MALAAAGGGIWARVTRDQLSQHPILVYPGAAEALAARDIAVGSLDRFAGLVAGITSHGRLVRVEADVLGRRLVLRLLFTTGDAIGINMAAHGAELCSSDLAERTGAVERFVHGQDVEKRANARALVEGRGRSVVAQATVPRETLAARARTTPEAMVRVLRTYAVGYAHLGTQNWTVQAANTIAAVFLACGQDIAYVTECATGLLDFDVTDTGDLHATVTLPSMLVGTVGGGSGLGTAAEALSILGCAGAGHATTLAEIVAATVLAGDLSLVAAFASHEFVQAHEKLGRNRPAQEPGA
jgi:hydroxymethylglutaryl-CoA reductase (NADPH)